MFWIWCLHENNYYNDNSKNVYVFISNKSIQDCFLEYFSIRTQHCSKETPHLLDHIFAKYSEHCKGTSVASCLPVLWFHLYLIKHSSLNLVFKHWLEWTLIFPSLELHKTSFIWTNILGACQLVPRPRPI